MTKYLAYGMIMLICIISSVYAKDTYVDITATDGNQSIVGNQKDFTITVVNDDTSSPAGNETDLTVELALPDGLDFVDPDPDPVSSPAGAATGPVISATTITWTIPQLFWSEMVSIYYTVDVVSTGSQQSDITIFPSTGDANTANNSVSHILNVSEAPIDGVCGGDDGAFYYSGYTFSDLCGQGAASPSQPDAIAMSGRSWQCLSTNGGSDASCSASMLYCGDGYLNGSETCDDGNTTDGDGCSASCTWETPDCSDLQTTFSRTTGYVGDQITLDMSISSGFAIDTVDWGDSATTSVYAQTGTALHTYTVSGSYLPLLTISNTVSDTTISTGCTDETLTLAPTPIDGACGSANTMTYYGQDMLNSGSSTLCAAGMVENFTGADTAGGYSWDCLGLYSGSDALGCVADEDRCSDGTIHASETCDDSNTTDGDGCSSTCELEYCGDGQINNNSTEACDDGNSNNYDACPNDCQLAVCGDGVRDGTEECDDGNTSDTDSCTITCTLTSPPRSYGSSRTHTSSESLSFPDVAPGTHSGTIIDTSSVMATGEHAVAPLRTVPSGLSLQGLTRSLLPLLEAILVGEDMVDSSTISSGQHLSQLDYIRAISRKKQMMLRTLSDYLAQKNK